MKTYGTVIGEGYGLEDAIRIAHEKLPKNAEIVCTSTHRHALEEGGNWGTFCITYSLK